MPDRLDEILSAVLPRQTVKDRLLSTPGSPDKLMRDYRAGFMEGFVQAVKENPRIDAKGIFRYPGWTPAELRANLKQYTAEHDFLAGWVAFKDRSITHLKMMKAFIEDNSKEGDGRLCVTPRPFAMGNLRLSCHDLRQAIDGEGRAALYSVTPPETGPDLYYNDLKEMLDRAQKFDLRSISEADLLANLSFADELEAEGLLKLPYPVTLFEWSLGHDNCDCVVIWMESFDTPAFGPFVRLPYNGWSLWEIRGSNSESPLTTQARKICRAATVILSSLCAERIEIPASKSRAATAGEPPKLPAYSHTVIEIRGVVLDRKTGAVTGRTHRSPRMHWRRGHLRRFKNAAGEVYRITPIAPMLVGRADLGRVDHDYTILPKRGRKT